MYASCNHSKNDQASVIAKERSDCGNLHPRYEITSIGFANPQIDQGLKLAMTLERFYVSMCIPERWIIIAFLRSQMKVTILIRY